MILLQTGGMLTLLETILTDFSSTLPKLMKALVIFVVGWIIAKMIAKLVRNILVRTPIDSLTKRLNDIDIVSKTGIEIIPSTVLSKMLYYILMLLFTLAATDVLDMPAISELMLSIMAFIPQLISAGIVLLIGIFIADFIKNMISTICTSLGIPSAKLIAGFVFWFIFLTALVSAMTQAGINTEFIMSNLSVMLAGGVFAFALGYGIASKDMMANFLASFYTKDKFKIGDQITIEGINGEIVDVDNNSVLLQCDGKKVVIPLKKLSSENVEIHES